jgi:cytidyltransferase-like protein
VRAMEGGRSVYRWHGLDEVPAGWGDSVVTIGEFDGVHRGHQSIVARAAQLGRERGLPVVAVTFDPHPDEVIRPGTHPPLLGTARRRAELLGGLGVDAVCVLPFTLEFSRLDPEEFVRAVLVERLHANAVVVGADFRCGHKAAGDVALISKLGEKYDYTTEGLPLLALDGVTISSTHIRARHPGRSRPGDAPLAGRDLDRHQPHLRRHRADGRGLRARPARPRPVRGACGDRLRHPAARHPPLRLGRGPGRADAPGRRPDQGALRGLAGRSALTS